VRSFVEEARRILADKVSLPTGVYLEFAGAAEAQRAATRELMLHAAVAAAGIVMLLLVVLATGEPGIDSPEPPVCAGRRRARGLRYPLFGRPARAR